MGKGLEETEERRNPLHVVNCRGALGENKSSFPGLCSTSTEGPLRARLHYLDEKTLPPGSNNDDIPCPLSALNPGISEILKQLGL